MPDVSRVREDIAAVKEKHVAAAEQIHQENMRRLRRAKAMLRANPSASSRRHDGVFETLKKMREDGQEDSNS